LCALSQKLNGELHTLNKQKGAAMRFSAAIQLPDLLRIAAPAHSLRRIASGRPHVAARAKHTVRPEPQAEPVKEPDLDQRVRESGEW
jgi:hypothetical protein